MSCFHPLLALPQFVQENGKVKYKIVPLTKTDECLVTDPEKLWNGEAKDQNGNVLSVKRIPCGQCIGCRIDYSRNWANRLMLENEYHGESYFLTLTYNDEYVPHSWYPDPDTGEAYRNMTLRPKDLQDFMKRLRREQEYHFGNRIRFFACGEYGSQTQRPHYHAIVFGLHLDDLEPFGRSMDGFQYFRSAALEKIWPFGFVGVAAVSWETCAYVARYVVKKQKGAGAEVYRAFNLVPEFVRMSRKPGIAAQWYEDHKYQAYQYDVINLATAKGGRKFKPPRYFDQKFDIEYPEQMSLIKENREKVAKAITDAKMKDFSGSYLEMLANEEYDFKERVKNLRRNLK